VEITVGEFVEQLKIFPKDATIGFGGLDFNRLKMRGPKLVQVEFVQLVYRDENGDMVVEEFE
jgi:hypothetical protein